MVTKCVLGHQNDMFVSWNLETINAAATNNRTVPLITEQIFLQGQASKTLHVT